LSCFRSGRSPTEKISDIVQAAFADFQKVFTGHALAAFCHQEILVELTFLDTVITASLLLRTKLHAVFGSLFAALAMLAGRIAAAFKSTFAGIAAFAFQEKLFAFTAAKFAN